MEEVEIWKSLKFLGYPDYEVSNMGQVKSLERVVIYKDGRKHLYKEKILKPSNDKDGYLLVGLYKNRKMKTFKVHRIVCLAFLENPDNLPQINHKNEIKTDNRVENLEWITPKENTNYGTHNERVSKTKKGIGSKPIIQLDLQGNFIKEFNSATTASEELNIKNTNICMCCKGKMKTAKGYKWVYKSDYKPTYTQLEINFN